MEKISEYIPIIIILVSLIFSILGKKRKPGKITQESNLPEKIPEEIFKESSFPQTFTETYQNHITKKPDMQIFNKQESKLKSITTVPVISELEIEEDNSPFSFEEDDDVVRAIIYSEIINRKEF